MTDETKTSLFDDLPDAGEGGSAGGGSAPAADEDKKKADEQKIKDLERAKKAEETRLERAQRELREKREARKAAEKERDGEEDKGEEDTEEDKKKKEPEKPPVVDPRDAVREVLDEEKKKAHQADIAKHIRTFAKSRQEAEEIYQEALRLPASGDARLDAEFAANRVQRLKESARGYVPPSISGGSFATDDFKSGDREIDAIPEGVRKLAKQMDITNDELKKYYVNASNNNGLDLTTLFTRIKQIRK